MRTTANDIVIRVTSRNDAKPGMDAARADVDRLQAETKALGEEFKRTSGATDNFGQSLKGSSARANEVHAIFDRLERDSQRLREEFQRTGNTDPFGHLLGTAAERDLERVKTDVTRTLADAGKQGGQEMGKGLSASLQGVFSTPVLGPIAVAGLVAAVAAALPAVNALLLSTAGLGGIALGVVGQLHDPAVKTAFTDLGHDLQSALADATRSFAGPLEAAAHILTADLKSALGTIDFSALSRAVVPLANGLGMLVREMMPGFNEMLKAAEPILEQFAALMPEIGHAVSDMFADFADGGQGAIEGLRTIVILLVGMLEGTGMIVDAFSHLYQWGIAVEDTLAGWVTQVAALSNLPGLAIFAKISSTLDLIRGGEHTVQQFGRSFYEVADAGRISAISVGAFADAVSHMATVSHDAAKSAKHLFDQLMGVDQGTLGWNTSMTSLHDTLAKNVRTLDEHTKAGQENVGAILSAVTANMQLYQAQVAAGMSSADAARQYDVNEQALERQLRALGYNQQAIDGIVGKYRTIPDAANSAATTMQHMADAVNNLDDTLRTLFNLPNHKDITVGIHTVISGVGASAIGSVASAALAGLGHRAQGGPVKAGVPYVVGDGGRPELFVPNSDGYVMPDAAAGGRGGTTVWTGPGVDSAFASFVQKLQATGQLRISPN